MKFIRLLLLLGLLLPVSAFAHTGDHHQHNFVTIVAHFFSQPDHLLMVAMVTALLWSILITRRIVLVRRVLHFVHKLIKRAP